MSVSPRARADPATRNSQLAGVAPMKNGAQFGASSHPDPTDATHGRLKDSDLARCLKRREMALWAPDEKRHFRHFSGAMGVVPWGSGLDFELCIGALDDHGPENQRIHKPTTPKRPLKVENSSEFGRPGHGD